MVSSSKILTVSYGTFSCTAEGFDDPLEVVKEATQFFRGVVGEDRFFGAEPPQFDPELASEYLRDRLAEPGSGTLSLGSPPRVMAAAASAGAMAAAMSGRTEEVAADDLLPDDDTIEATAVLTERPEPATADLVPEVALDDVAPDGTEAAPAPQPSAPDDITAKLDRIRAVVASVEDEADAPRVALDQTPEEAPESDALETLLDELVVESGDTEAAELDVALFDEEEEDAEVVSDLSDDLDVPEADHDSALDAAVASLMAEDDDEEDAPDSGALPLVATTAAAAALATGPMRPDAEPDEIDDLDEAPEDDPEAALDRAWAAEAAPDPEAETAAPVDDLSSEDRPEPAPVRARIVKVKRAAFEQAIDEGTLEEVLDEPAPDGFTPDDTSSLSPEEEEELARELAAVKAELASDFGAWDEDDDAALADTTDTAADDDEDDALMTAATPLRLDNPITEPEEDLAPDWDEEVAEAVQDSARKAVKLASPARAMLTEGEVGDGDTSRLLDQTNTEMDEPEGNRRRSAIAHLRAAVAATKADRLLGQKADAAEEQEPYREDLASVVRPRRPQSVSHPSPRPAAHNDAPTPLKLVAEQRVAPAPDASEAGPVRPRRVRRTVPAPETQAPAEAGMASGFAAYAQDVGAAELPELLEAAAAYMSYVEGRDQFSRPQLMTTLRQAEVTDSSREDRLRSFGQLLREGKIRKTSGGRFTAAETISFKPAANG
ncbi:putative Lipoprotein [Mameliella alba]|uniref:Putative Lipoprotein n=2 Tax=Mameliella alba TaxID=561184 RepID=A0A0B3SVA1_9RHOB|nr:putative Lipoprotein [Mameliella alba]